MGGEKKVESLGKGVAVARGSFMWEEERRHKKAFYRRTENALDRG